MPTASEENRFKRIDPDLHLMRVEPHTFRGSAHAPEAVEPPAAVPTNRESPEAVEPPERPVIEPPPQPEPLPARTGVEAPEAVEPPERPEVSAPEAVEPPERPEVSAPEPAGESQPRPAIDAPESIDLFALARERLNPLTTQRRK